MIQYLRESMLVLVLVIVSGVALAGVNAYLGPIIAKNEAKAKALASLELVPGSASAELTQVAGKDVFRLSDAEGRLAGWAILSQAPGYADAIKVMVGVTADASRITGMKVLYNQETPGLGNKITSTAFRAQYVGKGTARPLQVSKAATDDQIQAITGATISSQAATTAVNEAVTPEMIRALASAAGLTPTQPTTSPDAVSEATPPGVAPTQSTPDTKEVR